MMHKMQIIFRRKLSSAGLFDIGGQVLNIWEPKNRYFAMTTGIVGAIALFYNGLIGLQIGY
jgi:hypothetical protein